MPVEATISQVAVKLLIHPDVFETITQETLPFVDDKFETGGILIGRWLDQDTVLVVAATGAGPAAHHERLSFAVDTDHANNRLAAYRYQYPGVDYIGEWHKHPPTLDRPSGGDLYTARRLLAYPDYPDRLINPIVVVRDGQLLVNFYYLDQTLADFVKLQRRVIQAEMLPGLLAGGQTLPLRSQTLYRQNDPAWWLGTGEARRDEEERRLAQAGFSMEGSSNLDETTWLFKYRSKRNSRLHFEFQCYGKYPITPPSLQVYYKGKEANHWLTSQRLTMDWKPAAYLAEICQELESGVRQNSRKLGVRTLAGIVSLALLLVIGSLIFFSVSQLNTSKAGESIDNSSRTATAGAEELLQRKAASEATIGAGQTQTAQANQAANARAEATATARSNATATAQAIQAATVNAAVTARVLELQNVYATATALAKQYPGGLAPTPAPGRP
ncbi:MAG TPA: Mov34/MPN/PAD-1 family protein [Chloroflexia bacterium]|nr:Mov34/MPN/PAD-1 family protein [Chloroflexia bacterium]